MVCVHVRACVRAYMHTLMRGRVGRMNRPRICTTLRCPSCHWSAVLYDSGVGGVLEVVRPKVGAAEGRVGGGSPPPPPRENFVKDTKSCVLGTSDAVCSRVEYSTQYDCRCITDLQVRV